MKSLYEQMGGPYHLGEDGMRYPNLCRSQIAHHYGKYGRLCHIYLKEQCPAL